MSDSTPFRHQDYWASPATGAFELIRPAVLIKPESPEFAAALDNGGKAFRQSGISRIILVHGTLAGTDALGWYGHWGRLLPGISRKLKATYKGIVDKLSGDRGNYSREYVELFEQSLNSDTGAAKIAVERFDWTSENHHLGRADAAVRLADRLMDLDEVGEKVLLWGHSHAGNVFALISQLFGTRTDARTKAATKFFDSSRHFLPTTTRIDLVAWQRLEERLGAETGLKPRLDMVTFGTPVRYGWEATGFGRLLHFVNHHPSEGVEPFRTVWPNSTGQFLGSLKGEYGDFVQQAFVARSDFPPAVWSWNAWKATRQLRDLLEASELKHRRIDRLRQGVRVADKGRCLLVDYAIADPSAKEICGHAVYTESNWLAFHVKNVAKYLSQAYA